MFLYFVFSAVINIYKVVINGLFSPMVKNLSVYILNPITFMIYFIIGYDFLYEGKRNWFYFIINIIVSVIISFFGCIFNEFLVLSCCGLDYETHSTVSERASKDNINKNNTLMDDFIDNITET